MTLGEAESHHALRVVGVPPGGEVTLYDGSGWVAVATLARVEGGRALFEAAQPQRPVGGAERWLLLAQLKGPALDQAIRMATELGVAHVQVVHAARSIARSDKRARWQRVAEAAVGQCGRPGAPAMLAPCGLAEALARLPAGVVPVLAHPGATATLDPGLRAGPLALLIGPEGGWSDEERGLALQAGAVELRLGPWVLRADTAVAAALALAAG